MCFGTSIIVKNDQFGKLVSTGNFLSNFSLCLKESNIEKKRKYMEGSFVYESGSLKCYSIK